MALVVQASTASLGKREPKYTHVLDPQTSKNIMSLAHQYTRSITSLIGIDYNRVFTICLHDLYKQHKREPAVFEGDNWWCILWEMTFRSLAANGRGEEVDELRSWHNVDDVVTYFVLEKFAKDCVDPNFDDHDFLWTFANELTTFDDSYRYALYLCRRKASHKDVWDLLNIAIVNKHQGVLDLLCKKRRKTVKKGIYTPKEMWTLTNFYGFVLARQFWKREYKVKTLEGQQFDWRTVTSPDWAAAIL